jgi:sugar transferase (PEP-CTERM/EpsH1 system associated)
MGAGMTEAKKRALLLVHRIPYPPDKGDKIRSWRLFQFLAERFDLSLGCFVDDRQDMQHCEFLRGQCETAHFVPLDPFWAKLKSTKGFLTGEALSLPFYQSTSMQKWVAEQVREKPFDLAFGFSSSIAPYLQDKAIAKIRMMDLVDADSDKWRQYAREKSFPMRQIYQREANLLARTEVEVSQWADQTFLITPEEAELVQNLPQAATDKINYWRNGVDTDYFSPHAEFEGEAEDSDLIFTGAMDYWANEQAVLWFVENVWPILREKRPQIKLAIVGARPGPLLQKLNDENSIRVTGRVADIRPWLARAKIAIAPLRIARGVQNKVLEAMAMGRVVIASDDAASGLERETKACFQIVENNSAGAVKAWSEAVETMLDDEVRAEALGRKARVFVEAHYSWAAQLGRLSSALRQFDV